MQSLNFYENTEVLVGIKNDLRYKPFLSFTTLRIIGLIIFGFTQLVLVTYVGMFTTVISIEELNGDNAQTLIDLFASLLSEGELSTTIKEFKVLVTIWPLVKAIYSISRLVPPLLVVGLFGRLIQRPDKTVRVIIYYGVLTLIVFAAELIFYYMGFDQILLYLSEAENIEDYLIFAINRLAKTAMIFYSNLNIFLDMLLAVIFFKFYMLAPKSEFFKKHIKVYRSMSLLVVLYIIASTLIIGFEKNNIVKFPLALNSLLSARGIYVYLLFFAMCIYFRFRFPNLRNTGNYLGELQKSNLEIYNFTVFSCLILLGLTLISRFTELFSIFNGYRLDYAYNYFYLVPWILFYNYTIKPRFKYIVIFYGIYYAILGFILFGAYSYVLVYLLEVFKVISNTFA